MKKNDGLKTLGDLPISGDARMPQADITNAAELFGDPFGDIGDIEDGDFEDGDLYGDIINDSSLSAFNLISGDIEDGDFEDGDLYGDADEMGAPRRNLRKLRNPAIAAASGVAGGLAARAAYKRFMKRKAAKAAQKRAIVAKMRAGRTRQTLVQQAEARNAAGKIARNQKMPFFQVTGAKMNSSPIDPLERFVADMFKYNLDRQASDTPFYQESALGIFAAGTWTCTATGTLANRFYTGLILQLGINYLNAAPGTIFTVTATLPTINGTLTVAAQPWIFTIQKQYDVRFLFFPWQLVSNRPFPVLGQYSNANPIIVQVTGLPAASAVSLVVPGSLHPWTVAMRNALI